MDNLSMFLFDICSDKIEFKPSGNCISTCLVKSVDIFCFIL